MSSSCVGTCSNCGVRRFWLSCTYSLQLDDGSLKCLPHPGESDHCEKRHGLTMAQASERGRLYFEAFHVCRTCGADGQTLRKVELLADTAFAPFAGHALVWLWGLFIVLAPLLEWFGSGDALVTVGLPLLATPIALAWTEWRDPEARSRRPLPRADAPGNAAIPPPTAGRVNRIVVGKPVCGDDGKTRIAGSCCERPDWICASSASNDDHIPCHACGKGTMAVSEHAIH